MYCGMSMGELFGVIMFALAFNLMWYFILKYQKEKDKNKKLIDYESSNGIAKKPPSTASKGY